MNGGLETGDGDGFALTQPPLHGTRPQHERGDARRRQAFGGGIGIDEGQKMLTEVHGEIDTVNIPHMSRGGFPDAVRPPARLNFRNMAYYDSDRLAERIQQRLEEVGISARAASLQVGASPDLLRNLFNHKSRTLRSDYIIKLARVLQVSESWLLGTSDEMGPHEAFNEDAPNFGLPHAGLVKAGLFQPQNDLDQTADLRRVAIAPDPRFPARDQAVFDVVGDSMSGPPARIMEGMKVHTVSRSAWERRFADLPDGSIVVVARSRDGLPERELTLKRLRYFKDRWELRPESSNPVHTPLVFPLNPPQDQPVQVEILAVVLAAVWLYG